MHPNNASHGTYTGAGEIRFQRLVSGPVQRVWSYLVDPEKRARWLARGPLEPRVGGRLRFEFHNSQLSAPGDGIPAKYQANCQDGCGFSGTVTRFEPPRLLSHTWDEPDGSASEVTYELTPQGRDVLLVLTHRKLGDDRGFQVSVGAGWHTHLGILVAELAGTPKPSFWSTHAALEREYEKLLAALAP